MVLVSHFSAGVTQLCITAIYTTGHDYTSELTDQMLLGSRGRMCLIQGGDSYLCKLQLQLSPYPVVCLFLDGAATVQLGCNSLQTYIGL